MSAPTIYLTVGISGSGKSRYAKWFCKTGPIEINADEVRKSLGDISSQDSNDEVWKIIDRETTARLAGGYSVFLSNTNLHLSCIRNLKKKYPYNSITVFIMEDSFDLDLCKSRVKKDIEDKVERSNVPEDIIDKQFEKFNQLIENLRDEKNIDVYENTEILLVSKDYETDYFT